MNATRIVPLRRVHMLPLDDDFAEPHMEPPCSVCNGRCPAPCACQIAEAEAVPALHAIRFRWLLLAIAAAALVSVFFPNGWAV